MTALTCGTTNRLSMSDIKQAVGVVGAGVIGASVADDVARNGHDVVLVDICADALQHARDDIRRNCRMSRMLTGVAVEADEVLSRITLTESIAQLSDCQLVIENVTERWEVKNSVYKALDETCGETTIFIANTSAIPITQIGSMTNRPDRVVGVHFMNPVPMKRAVELIAGRLTSDDTLQRTNEFLATLGKAPIGVKDSCGFISNRVLMLTVNEAAFLVYEGVANAETVDQVFRECFGHPMGPLETADLIGLDTVRDSVEVLYDYFADPKFRPCPLLKELCAAGWYGRKAGRGFHSYAAGLRRPSATTTATGVADRAHWER
jgi:3-hydroxybutyryl-CoA dehydrogenase